MFLPQNGIDFIFLNSSNGFMVLDSLNRFFFPNRSSHPPPPPYPYTLEGLAHRKELTELEGLRLLDGEIELGEGLALDLYGLGEGLGEYGYGEMLVG
jgi:hypothetical protein